MFIDVFMNFLKRQSFAGMDLSDFIKNICFEDKQKSNKVRMAWVNDDRMFILGWTIHLNNLLSPAIFRPIWSEISLLMFSFSVQCICLCKNMIRKVAKFLVSHKGI